MTQEERLLLLKNSIRVVEIRDSRIDEHSNTRAWHTESDFPVEGILEVAKKLVPKKRKIYAVQVCINGEMQFLGKKEAGDLSSDPDLSLYLFNAELIDTQGRWEDWRGNWITEEGEEPREYDLRLEEIVHNIHFDKTKLDNINVDYSVDYFNELEDGDVHFVKIKYFRIKKGNIA